MKKIPAPRAKAPALMPLSTPRAASEKPTLVRSRKATTYRITSMGMSRREALEMADLRTGVSRRSRVDVVVTDIKTPRRAISGVTQGVNQLHESGRIGPAKTGLAGSGRRKLARKNHHQYAGQGRPGRIRPEKT